MLCQRCNGLLICEHLGELRAELGRMCLTTRCINCGCIEDSVIRANRLRHPGKTVVSQGIATTGEVGFLRPHCETWNKTALFF